MRATCCGLVLLLLPCCKYERGLNPVLGPEELQTTVEQPTDLPVPKRLRLRSTVNESRSFRHGDFRSAYLQYEGRLSLAKVRDFLRDRLPTHGWELVQEEQPTQERVLQRWLRRSKGGNEYLLVAEIEDDVHNTRLSYDLRTRRAVAPTVAPAKASASQRAGRE